MEQLRVGYVLDQMILNAAQVILAPPLMALELVNKLLHARELRTLATVLGHLIFRLDMDYSLVEKSKLHLSVVVLCGRGTLNFIVWC